MRFYQVAFGRVPDKDGLHFNVNAFETSGQNLKSISEGFAHSPEFAAITAAARPSPRAISNRCTHMRSAAAPRPSSCIPGSKR